ncbi:MAG: hypothetical protein HYX84_05385 [Chloroflexi bacterium]|nr:hypothetical protein [Chloroflexota bacterium]
MTTSQQDDSKTSGRPSVIRAVKTYLNFFSLVVLVVEAGLGAIALTALGTVQLVAVYSMALVILALIVVVSLFAAKKPEVLLQSVGDTGHLRDFTRAITGHWWERITPDDRSSLSYVIISPYLPTNTVMLHGRVFNAKGEESAKWDTVATCIDVGKRKVFYYWNGHHFSKPGEPWEGFGEISFYESEGKVTSGGGLYSDTNLTDVKTTTRKAAKFQRSTEEETRIMRDENRELVEALVRSKLGIG